MQIFLNNYNSIYSFFKTFKFPKFNFVKHVNLETVSKPLMLKQFRKFNVFKFVIVARTLISDTSQTSLKSRCRKFVVFDKKLISVRFEHPPKSNKVNRVEIGSPLREVILLQPFNFND